MLRKFAAMIPVVTFSYTLEDIDATAKKFWQQASECRVMAFSGQMGAGKTTFIHALCQYIGVTDVVTSPTFALINEYHFTDNAGTDKLIYHMDWYRLKNIEEAINAGMEDCLNNKEAYCFIEWPGQAEALLPFPHYWINIQSVDPYKREIEMFLRNKQDGRPDNYI